MSELNNILCILIVIDQFLITDTIYPARRASFILACELKERENLRKERVRLLSFASQARIKEALLAGYSHY